MADDFKFEIKESFGTLSESSKGWTIELNSVSWNDREPKYDIRSWSEDHKKMGKGIALSKDEVKKLREILDGLNLD
jgi:hypothetical protein